MPKLSKYFLALSTSCALTGVHASDFNLPFVNSSSLGVAYADWASAAQDASTAFTNPAGLVHLPKTQMVFNALEIFGTSRYDGTASTPPYPFPFPVNQSGTAPTDIEAFMPSFYFSTPVSESLVFGFNVTAPFGLGTDYGTESIVRYVSTRSNVVGIDIGPSLGYKINEWLSIGAGLDALRLDFTLNSAYGPPLSFPGDTLLTNNQNGWGYGWHGGVLIDLDKTRIGASYNSRISIRTNGSSTIYAPMSDGFSIYDQTSKSALPARAQVSAQHELTDRWTAMATVFYTHWKTFSHITMEKTLTPFGTTVPVTIPFNYHNTFDYAFGTAYQANQQWKLRAGVMILTTPSNDQDRAVADPIGSTTILTVGAQIKMNEAFKVDVGVGHSFFKKMGVNLTTPLSTLNGKTNTQTTAIGGQLTWTIA